MHNKSLRLLRLSLAIVYLWFGALKIIGISPVADLVKGTYPWMPEPLFLMTLGIGEMLIGVLLLYRRTLRLGITFMWLQLAGIFTGVLLQPTLYLTHGNILYPTMSGEFVIKNLVLIAAGYVLWQHSHSKTGYPA